MMLLDHFQPPLSEQRDWRGIHHAWATYLSADLNLRLPQHCFAQPHVQFGVEIDVAAIEATERPGVVVAQRELTQRVWRGKRCGIVM